MRNGRLVEALPTLAASRSRANAQVAALPQRLAFLDPVEPYEVEVSAALHALAAEVDRRT